MQRFNYGILYGIGEDVVTRDLGVEIFLPLLTWKSAFFDKIKYLGSLYFIAVGM